LFLKMFFSTPAFSQYNVDALLEQAKNLIQKENYTEALTKLNICLSAQPANSEAYYYRGACKYALFDNNGAEHDFTMAISRYSRFLYDAYLFRSQVRYKVADYAGAIDDLNKVIAREPSDHRFYLQRAFAKLASGDYNGALADCQKCLNLNPIGAEDIYLCKATAEDALGNYPQAIADFDRALKFNSVSEDVLVRRGNTRYKTEDYCGAIEDYNAALKIDTANTLAYYYRAEAEFKQDSTTSALQDYSKVIVLEPRNSYAYFNRATIYANLGKYKNAIADYDKVLQLNPDNVDALRNRAKVKQSNNDLKGAIKDYDRVIELYPYFMEAYYDRARIKSELHDNSGAQKDFETGKMMSEVFHSKNKSQLSRDSALLANLFHLSADFNSTPKTMLDTLNIEFKPFFYIDQRKSESGSNYAFDPVLSKISKQENKSFYFTNSESHMHDTIVKEIKGGNDSWAHVINATNGYMLSQALTAINTIIENDSGNALAYFQRAIITCREIELTGSFEEPTFYTSTTRRPNENKTDNRRLSAIEDFSKAIQLQPGFSYAYFNRANLKCALRNFDGALKDYESAIKANSGLAEAHFNMGFIMYYQNEKSLACDEFSKAGELGIPSAYTFMKQYCSTLSK